MTPQNVNTPKTKQPKVFWIVTAGWAVFFVLWALFILGWGQGEVLLKGASMSAMFATVTAAALSPFVWRITGQMQTSDTLGVGFFLLHLVAATIFAVVWTFTAGVLGMLWEGGSLMEIQWGVQVNSWRLFMGVWLYFIVAGISYAARINGRLQEQRQIAARAEAFAAEARLSAMRSQLQPHFLFNALHSVSVLIETEPERAVDAMEMLGDLLRYAIRDRNTHWVALGEEWQFVNDYVELQKLRFGDQVQVESHIESDTEQVKVPAFLLQPLVENAFIHGISSLPKGGHIWIEAGREGQNLRVVVSDDGVGIGTLEAGNSVQGEIINREKPGGAGSGLENLRLRLKSLYGPTATLTIERRMEGGTIATVICPINLA